MTARCAAIPGDCDDADREFRSVSAMPGRRVEQERAFLRFRSGNTNDAAEWMLGSEEQLQDRQMLDLLEALVEGAIRSGDSELAQSCLALWCDRTGTESAGRCSGAMADQARLTAWLGDLAWSMPDVAIGLFRRALELEPRNESARLKLAVLLLQYEAEEAWEQLQYLNSRIPHSHEIRFQQAACARELGNRDEAIRILDRLLQYRPDDVRVLLKRARLHLDVGDPEGAEPLLRRAPRDAAVLPGLPVPCNYWGGKRKQSNIAERHRHKCSRRIGGHSAVRPGDGTYSLVADFSRCGLGRFSSSVSCGFGI